MSDYNEVFCASAKDSLSNRDCRASIRVSNDWEVSCLKKKLLEVKDKLKEMGNRAKDKLQAVYHGFLSRTKGLWNRLKDKFTYKVVFIVSQVADVGLDEGKYVEKAKDLEPVALTKDDSLSISFRHPKNDVLLASLTVSFLKKNVVLVRTYNIDVARKKEGLQETEPAVGLSYLEHQEE